MLRNDKEHQSVENKSNLNQLKSAPQGKQGEPGPPGRDGLRGLPVSSFFNFCTLELKKKIKFFYSFSFHPGF